MKWAEKRAVVMNEDLRKELSKDVSGHVTGGSEILNVKRVTPQIPPKFYSERQDRGIASFETIPAEV